MAASWSYSTSGEIEIPPLTEASTVSVSSGVTVTNTIPLTGSAPLTVTGGGTLFLSVDSPDFSGGVTVGKAIVSIATGGAFGTGDVSITGYTAAKGASRVEFVNGAAAITLANDFDAGNVGKSDSTRGSFVFRGSANGSVTFTGKVQGGDYLSMYGVVPTEVNFNNDVVVSGGTVYCYYPCYYHFNGKVVTTRVYAYSTAGGSATYPSAQLHFSGQNSQIGTIQTRMNGTLDFHAADVAGGAVLVFDSTKGLNMNGFSQTAAYISLTGAARSLNGGTGAAVATLTLTGGVASASSTAVMSDKMSLVIADSGADGDFEQVQVGGKHTMSGTLAVNRGTYSITGGATFLKATGLAIGAGGTLKIEPGSAMPFANNKTVDVSFSTGASYEGDPIEIMAKSLTINGEAQPDGVYNHDVNPAVPEGITVLMLSKTVTLGTSGNVDLCGTEGAVDGYWLVTVPSGVTVTNTTALAAASGCNIMEVSGGGTFVQLVDSPGFGAEVRVAKAVVGAATGGALGTGDVKISGSSAAGGVSRVDFLNGADAMTVGNDFYITGSGGESPANAHFGFRGAEAGSVTFTGKVLGASGILISMSGDVPTTVNFNNDVVVEGGTVYCRYACTYHFNGRVVADVLNSFSAAAGGSASNPTASLHLSGQNSQIGTIRTRMNGTLYLHAEDAVGGAALVPDSIKGHYMNGFSQTISYIAYATHTPSIIGGTGDTTATLTLTGGVESAQCNVKFTDRLSIVVDDKGADGDFVQTVTNGAHTMSGELTVKRGTLALTGAATFKNVSAVTVAGGGLSISTSAPVFGTAAEVRTKNINMQIADGATVAIADGSTVNVNRLFVGGRGVVAGDYTGEGGPAGATMLPGLVGTGILHVGRSSGQGCILTLR